MLSRVADSLFWMARNIERADNNARVLSTRLINRLEAADTKFPGWEEVLEICASLSDYRDKYMPMDTAALLHYLIFSKENVNSLMSCIAITRNQARGAREIIPHELWEMINEFYWYCRDTESRGTLMKDIDALLHRVRSFSFMVQGAIEASMFKGGPYRFIQIGIWLERAEKTARILNVLCEKLRREGKDTKTPHYYQWLAALQLLNAYDAYLKHYPPSMDAQEVLAFLIGEPSYPRSIRYCVDHVTEAVYQLESGQEAHYSKELFQALQIVKEDFSGPAVRDMDMEEWIRFMDRFQNHCNQIGHIFSRTYYLQSSADSRGAG